jgi:hypothetical protein
VDQIDLKLRRKKPSSQMTVYLSISRGAIHDVR